MINSSGQLRISVSFLSFLSETQDVHCHHPGTNHFFLSISFSLQSRHQLAEISVVKMVKFLHTFIHLSMRCAGHSELVHRKAASLFTDITIAFLPPILTQLQLKSKSSSTVIIVSFLPLYFSSNIFLTMFS